MVVLEIWTNRFWDWNTGTLDCGTLEHWDLRNWSSGLWIADIGSWFGTGALDRCNRQSMASNDQEQGDPFRRHFNFSLTESDVGRLSNDPKPTTTIKFPYLGDVISSATNATEFSPQHLRPNLRRVVQSKIDQSPFQKELLSVLIDYKDLLYVDFATTTSRTRNEEISFAYSLHALNHVLKSRHRILKNNSKFGHPKSNDSDDGDSMRDQGLTRPKVLILLPFRYMALNVVKIMIDLLSSDQSGKKSIMNKKRFFKEYGVEEEVDQSTAPSKRPKLETDQSKRPRLERPLDYKETFHDNIDDCFRLGLSIGKGTLKLFTEFYASDVILASPLGLRMALGAEGEKEYDFDFLSSIELLILDRSDVFLMQNWSHVLHILDHLHRQPRDAHGIDFSRVRPWCLDGWSKFYRQTIVFSALSTPEIRAVISGYCRNYEGRVLAVKEKNSGSLAQVIVPLPHAFQRFTSADILSDCEKRFEFFVQKVLPQYADASMSGTLIYVPSYYDFVRLRNHFKKNDNTISYVQICEYTSDKKVSSARDLFFHGDKHFLLYTERFHFYHRYRIRGVKNLIFYQLPTYPHFYNEMCNAMLDDRNSKNGETATLTCAVLFSKYDALRLAGVLGQEKASELLSSEKNVHMLVTE